MQTFGQQPPLCSQYMVDRANDSAVLCWGLFVNASQVTEGDIFSLKSLKSDNCAPL
jgi:hypothetical protein